jgi:hypothetical protein
MSLLSGVILGVFPSNAGRFLWRSWRFGNGVAIDVFTTGPYKSIVITWPVEHRRRK